MLSGYFQGEGEGAESRGGYFTSAEEATCLTVPFWISISGMNTQVS